MPARARVTAFFLRPDGCHPLPGVGVLTRGGPSEGGIIWTGGVEVLKWLSQDGENARADVVRAPGSVEAGRAGWRPAPTVGVPACGALAIDESVRWSEDRELAIVAPCVPIIGNEVAGSAAGEKRPGALVV